MAGIKYSFLFFLLLINVNYVFSQDLDFRLGINLYESAKYHEASEIFEKIETPIAKLFLAKSWLALGNELKTVQILESIKGDIERSVHEEIRFTRALAEFNLKNHTSALEQLYSLRNSASNASLRNEATRLYREIILYISLGERRTAFNKTVIREIQRDLVLMIFDSLDYPSAKALYTTLVNSSITSDDLRQIRQYETVLNNKNREIRRSFYPTPAPAGTHYHFGVILPEMKDNPDDLIIPQGLYNGVLMAVDEFNRNNTNRKVFIHFAPSDEPEVSSGEQLNYLIWNNHIDAVIGPLYSDDVINTAPIAEHYGIPLITPLANLDDINRNNPYLFQINPTFETRGVLFARFAYHTLGHRDFAVVVENGSLGEIEAFAFRSEVERLGGNIAYFFNDDFESIGFNFTKIIPYFQPEPELVDSTINWNPIDAIFLPFSGELAPTMLDIFLTELEALNTKASVLSSDELGFLDHSAERIRRLNMYYSDTFFISEGEPNIINFRIDHQNRFDMEANLFSFIGYDTASFLLHVLDKVQNPDYLKSALINQPIYKGLSGRIWFNSNNINQDIQIYHLTRDGPVKAN